MFHRSKSVGVAYDNVLWSGIGSDVRLARSVDCAIIKNCWDYVHYRFCTWSGGLHPGPLSFYSRVINEHWPPLWGYPYFALGWGRSWDGQLSHQFELIPGTLLRANGAYFTRDSLLRTDYHCACDPVPS